MMKLTPFAYREECGCLTYIIHDFNALTVTHQIVAWCDEHEGVLYPYSVGRLTEVVAR